MKLLLWSFVLIWNRLGEHTVYVVGYVYFIHKRHVNNWHCHTNDTPCNSICRRERTRSRNCSNKCPIEVHITLGSNVTPMWSTSQFTNTFVFFCFCLSMTSNPWCLFFFMYIFASYFEWATLFIEKINNRYGLNKLVLRKRLLILEPCSKK